MSLNLQDPLLRLTGIHPRQTGGPLFCQVLTDFARGGRRANSTPGPARGSKNSQIQHLLLKHHEISSSKSVIYCWIPSHIGIFGNEKVDKSAKESLNLEVTDFKIPFNNFKPFINKYVYDKWQTLWDETPFNKLKEIEPIVNYHRLVPKLSRPEEIVLACLRIGHTRVTHSCLLKREERPYCIGCDTPFTVRHFLLDCADFGRERRSLFQVNNLKDLFKDVSVENILSFLKNVNLFNKI